jgi:hypothetical protein
MIKKIYIQKQFGKACIFFLLVQNKRAWCFLSNEQ